MSHHLNATRPRFSAKYRRRNDEHELSICVLPEVMKEYKRSIDRSIREMDRECAKLQATEKKLIIEIKKCAKESQQMV
jgi:hypothetical protein